jgi:hypothetical protein
MMAEQVPISLLGAAMDAPLIAFSRRWPDTLHAVTMEQVVKGWKQGTFVSACGRSGLRLMALNREQQMAALWPPAVRGLAPDLIRCRECWEWTGRMRPRTRRGLR